MSGSQIPAVRSWMKANYQSAATATPVTGRSLKVWDGPQSEDTSFDQLSISAASRTVEPFTLRGGFSAAGSLREMATVDLVLTAFGAGGEDPEVVLERAYQWLALIEATTDADPTLGGLVDVAWLSESTDATDMQPQGWVVEITARVAFRAEN